MANRSRSKQNIYKPRKNLVHLNFPSGTDKTQTDSMLEKITEING